MKLMQLHYVVEVARHGNHISNTAEALHTSQPGISKHIQMLEEELGFEIFSRKRNRIAGLTEAGREVIVIAERILNDTNNLKRLGEEISAREGGSLTIATTHTQARYLLPKVIEKFIRRHPTVQIRLRQGNPTAVCELVESGEADIAIGTESQRQFPDLVRYECYELDRSIITKVGHPLQKIRKPTLQDVAKYPIITYDPAYSGRWKVMGAFRAAGIEPNIVFGAVDADVSKTYVDLGLGIAVMTTVAFDKARDTTLAAKSASHLFPPSTVYLSLRAKSYLRHYTYDFIQYFAPKLTREVVDASL